LHSQIICSVKHIFSKHNPNTSSKEEHEIEALSTNIIIHFKIPQEHMRNERPFFLTSRGGECAHLNTNAQMMKNY